MRASHVAAKSGFDLQRCGRGLIDEEGIKNDIGSGKVGLLRGDALEQMLAFRLTHVGLHIGRLGRICALPVGELAGFNLAAITRGD